MGLEPTTICLEGRDSAIELPPQSEPQYTHPLPPPHPPPPPTPTTATERTLTLLLPAPAAGNGHAATQPYQASALVLGPAEAADFLTSLPCQLPGSCSPSLAYWSRLADFVLKLIAAKQFVPRVDES